MVSICKTRFPHARFELGDARDLSRWPGGHFALVVFSGNGLCMVGHADRLRVIAEVFRVLRPGGVLVGSDSLESDDLRAFHAGDTYNPVEPGRMLGWLRELGCGPIHLSVQKRQTFRAYAPVPAAAA